MKTVVIVAEGTTQIALTPETTWERSVLEQVQKHQGALTILSGNVYECRGGYWRGAEVGLGDSMRAYDSTILRLDAP